MTQNPSQNWTRNIALGGEVIIIGHGLGTAAMWRCKAGQAPVYVRAVTGHELDRAHKMGGLWFPEELAEACPLTFAHLRSHDATGNLRTIETA